MAPRAHRAVGVILAASGLGLAACSSPPASSAPSGPPARLGSTLTQWQATRPASGDGGYGRAIPIDGTTTAEYTDVTTHQGRVVGWHQVFPAGSRLARAEAAVRTALPTDARQTASWRGADAGGGGFCEVVNYQSASLASVLGTGAPTSSGGAIGAEFYERTSHGAGSPSIATVNAATVQSAPFTQGEPC